MPSSASKQKSSKQQSFRAGQAVEWDASQGVVAGKVERVVTKPTRVKGYTAKASPEHPEVLVKSDRTGAEAVHRPAELRKSAAGKQTGTKKAGTRKPTKRKKSSA